jgi:hypothetical protein
VLEEIVTGVCQTLEHHRLPATDEADKGGDRVGTQSQTMTETRSTDAKGMTGDVGKPDLRRRVRQGLNGRRTESRL